MIDNGHPCFDFQRTGSVRGCVFHIPNAELRSSAESLPELQKSEEGKPCLTKSKSSNQKTGAFRVASPTSIKETGADTLVCPSQASFLHKRTSSTTKRKWTVIPANSSYGGALAIAVSKMVTRMVRNYDQDERQSDASLQWDAMAGAAESVSQNMEHEISQMNNGFDLSMKEAARQDSSTARIPTIPWLICEQLKDKRWETN